MSEVERYLFDLLPAERLRAPIAEWLRFHGLDPRRVMGSGWIERDPDAGAVRVLAYVLNDEGRIVCRQDPNGPPGVMVAVTEVVESRSEGPPLPWPIPLVEWLGPDRAIIRYDSRVIDAAGLPS